MGRIENRLRRIEREVAPKQEGPGYVVTDESGIVLDDDRNVVRP
jgi:hypothetical protein